MTDFARGVTAQDMSPVLRSRPAPSEEATARIQVTTGAIVDSRSPWPLWSKLQGFRIRTAPPREHSVHPGATTGVIPAHEAGCPEVALSTSDPPRYLPREAQHVSNPATGVTLALSVAAPELPPVHSKPHRTTPKEGTVRLQAPRQA